MNVIDSSEGMQSALVAGLLPRFTSLLALRRDQLREHGELGDLAHFIIVQAGDALEAIEAAAGIPIATNLVDGSRFGQPDFTPSWEWCLDHGDCWEAPFILSDDGFGIVLLVEKAEGIDPTIAAMCQQYSAPPPSGQPVA